MKNFLDKVQGCQVCIVFRGKDKNRETCCREKVKYPFFSCLFLYKKKADNKEDGGLLYGKIFPPEELHDPVKKGIFPAPGEISHVIIIVQDRVIPEGGEKTSDKKDNDIIP